MRVGANPWPTSSTLARQTDSSKFFPASSGKAGNLGFDEDQGIHDETVSIAEHALSDPPANKDKPRN
jgi:hypothetical protein